jgi:hypothetical protein
MLSTEVLYLKYYFRCRRADILHGELRYKPHRPTVSAPLGQFPPRSGGRKRHGPSYGGQARATLHAHAYLVSRIWRLLVG